MIQINWIMGALITFFCFFWKSHIHWPINESLGTLSTPQWEHLFGPPVQNRNKCAPLHFSFLVYIHGSWTLGKPRCYWEHLGECIWEYFGNLMEKESSSPSSPSKRKNCTLHEGMLSLPNGCMKFLFPKLCVTNFLSRLVAGAEFWGHSLWIRKQVAGLYFLISKFPLCSGEHQPLPSTIVEETLNTPPSLKTSFV